MTNDDETTYAAFEITCAVDERRDLVYGLILENLRVALAMGSDVTKHPALRLTVKACGEIVEYWTAEDVPLEDAPCSCGDPNHWFVKYLESEQ